MRTAAFSFRLLRDAGIGLLLMVSLPVAAQAQAAAAASPPASVPSGDTALVPAQFDELTAPIALYPDPLLAQILTAATYPTEINDAAQWVKDPANAALTGDALTSALENQTWDPSVKALAASPQVLAMMAQNPQWTELLGDLFLAHQSELMDSVQRLRQRAVAAGTLTSTPQQTVTRATPDQGAAPPVPADAAQTVQAASPVAVAQPIVIMPTQAQMVYVPTYNPWCVYGAWSNPALPPIFFGAFTGDCASAAAPVIVYSPPIYWPAVIYGWASFNWYRRGIWIDNARYVRFHGGIPLTNGVWVHDPAHRHGAAYIDREAVRRFGPAALAAHREELEPHRENAAFRREGPEARPAGAAAVHPHPQVAAEAHPPMVRKLSPVAPTHAQLPRPKAAHPVVASHPVAMAHVIHKEKKKKE